MAVVDFTQDPGAPFGTGNFRDDTGKIFYLHDPDTASEFVKTMPGAKLARNSPIPGADALPTTPGQAAADAATASVSDVPAAPEPGTPQFSGTAAAEGQAQTEAAVADLDKAVNAPPGQPAAPAGTGPGAQLVQNLQSVQQPPPAATTAAPAAPAVPGAPGAPAGAGAALVNSLAGVQDQMSARLQPDRGPGGVRQYPTGDLPLTQVDSGEQIAIKEGRETDRVAEELRDVEAPQLAGDQFIRNEYARKGRLAEQGFETQRNAARTAYGTNVSTAFESNAKAREAYDKAEAYKAALKKNDESLDPDRYMRNMSTGKYLSMIILAALNGGFGAINKQTQNGVIAAMDHAIDADIDKQKREIESGHVRIGNDVARFMQQGLDFDLAAKAARDNLIGNLAAFKDAEAKRVQAMPEAMGQADMLILPRVEQRAKERAAILRTLESDVNRQLRAGQTYGTTQVPNSPQNALAQETLEDRKIQRENAAYVGQQVGHDVSIDEAKEIRNDAQDLGKRLATGATARATLNQLRTELGMVKRDGKWQGDPDPGSRPFGYSGTDRSRLIDTYYANLKRADIMGMVREPSAVLQNEFAKITERPFFDSQIGQQLDAYEKVVNMAEEEARKGFSDEANRFYDRDRTPIARQEARAAVRTAGATKKPPSPATAPAATPPAPAAPPPPAAPAATKEKPKRAGNLKFEGPR